MLARVQWQSVKAICNQFKRWKTTYTIDWGLQLQQ